MSESYGLLLDAPLCDLLLRQTKGKLRRTCKKLSSPRRAIPTAIVAMLLLLYVVQVCITIAYRDPSTSFAIQSAAPLGMVCILLLKLVGVCIDRRKSGAGFRDEEVHQLLGGPFSHQQVRLYKVCGHAISIFFTSLFAAVFFRFHVPSFMAALSGAYAAMMFTYLAYTTIAVAAVNVTERTYRRCRILGCGIVVGVLAYLLYRVSAHDVRSMAFLQSLGDEAIALSKTHLGRLALLPFIVFTNVVVAETPWQWFRWMMLSLMLNYAALYLLMRLEVQFEKWAKVRERREFSSRQGWLLPPGKVAALADGSLAHQIPWMGGVGPIMWRQGKALSRLKGGLGWLLVPLGLAFAAGGFIAYNPTEGPFQTIAVIVVLTSVFLPGLLPFDFRGDLTGLAALKTMPLQPRSVVVGQLVVPLLLLTGFQLVALSTLLLHDRGLVGWILLTVCFLVPTNTIILALENLIFLLYPYRVAEFDMQATVRRIVMLMAKFCVVFMAGLLSLLAGLGVLGLKLATEDTPLSRAFEVMGRPLMLLTQLLVLCSVAAMVVGATCWAFRRFDLSEDLPL